MHGTKAAMMAVVLACCLCACSGTPVMGTNDLLKAPTLNRQQAEISLALEQTLNLSDIVFRSPQRGDKYRSSFLFQDLDGDGRDEAIVFYAFTSKSSEIRMKILFQDENGSWESLHDISGLGDQIEFVEFANIISADRPCMMAGWLDSSRGERQLEVYAMENGEFIREARHKYSAFSLADFGEDALAGILLVSQEKRNDPFEVRLLGNSGDKIVQLASVWLYQEVSSVLQMKTGYLWDGGAAVYIDEVWENDTVATEIIRVDADSLQLVAGGQEGGDSPEMQYYQETFRPDRLLSVDIDDDGIVEIPKSFTLPGIEESDEVTPVMLTVFWKPGETGLAPSKSAVVNSEAGYLLFFPERWADQVTVVDYPEANQRSFRLVDPKTDLPSTELLRIIIYSIQDYYEGQYPGEYIPLGEKGMLRYFGYLPSLEDEPLAISEQELLELFSLL